MVGFTARITRQEVLDAIAAYIEARGLGPVFVVQNIVPPVDGLGEWIVEFTADYELRKCTMLFQRAEGARPPQDLAMCTFHLLNLTADVPDDTWTTADYEAAEARFDTFWGAIKDRYSLNTVLAGYRWQADGPAFKPFGASLSPTLRNTARSVPGTTDTEWLPPQVAVSVTEVTAAKYTAFGVGVPGSTPGTGTTQIRNRWGRFYLPNPVIAAVGNGRWTDEFTQDIANAADSLYSGLLSDDFPVVMYSPTTGHSWSVDEIHVDDICDVIRSRRFTDPLNRQARAIP